MPQLSQRTHRKLTAVIINTEHTASVAHLPVDFLVGGIEDFANSGYQRVSEIIEFTKRLFVKIKYNYLKTFINYGFDQFIKPEG